MWCDLGRFRLLGYCDWIDRRCSIKDGDGTHSNPAVPDGTFGDSAFARFHAVVTARPQKYRKNLHREVTFSPFGQSLPSDPHAQLLRLWFHTHLYQRWPLFRSRVFRMSKKKTSCPTLAPQFKGVLQMFGFKHKYICRGWRRQSR